MCRRFRLSQSDQAIAFWISVLLPSCGGIDSNKRALGVMSARRISLSMIFRAGVVTSAGLSPVAILSGLDHAGTITEKFLRNT